MGKIFGELMDPSLGPISFYAGDEGLQRISFSTLHALKQKERLTEEKPSLLGLDTIGILLTELQEYLIGTLKTFTVKIDWNVIDGFQKQVLCKTIEIPYGQVKTYGEIARILGNPHAARAVGGALSSNPMPIVIPCHRVIGAGGKLTGYVHGSAAKSFLLQLEGCEVRRDKLIYTE